MPFVWVILLAIGLAAASEDWLMSVCVQSNDLRGLWWDMPAMGILVGGVFAFIGFNAVREVAAQVTDTTTPVGKGGDR